MSQGAVVATCGLKPILYLLPPLCFSPTIEALNSTRRMSARRGATTEWLESSIHVLSRAKNSGGGHSKFENQYLSAAALSLAGATTLELKTKFEVSRPQASVLMSRHNQAVRGAHLETVVPTAPAAIPTLKTIGNMPLAQGFADRKVVERLRGNVGAPLATTSLLKTMIRVSPAAKFWAAMGTLKTRSSVPPANFVVAMCGVKPNRNVPQR